jgi:hypothetical protein
MEVLNEDPQKKAPAGENINALAKEINWPIPTWIEAHLFEAEFKHSEQKIIDMLNTMGEVIEKAMQSGAADDETIEFVYFRKHQHQRKPHGLELQATLFEHPDYGTIWLEIAYGR